MGGAFQLQDGGLLPLAEEQVPDIEIAQGAETQEKQRHRHYQENDQAFLQAVDGKQGEKPFVVRQAKIVDNFKIIITNLGKNCLQRLTGATKLLIITVNPWAPQRNDIFFTWWR
jgi:hypothetical protein